MQCQNVDFEAIIVKTKTEDKVAEVERVILFFIKAS